MRIKWEVNDGYIGKSRPHYLDIDDSEFEDCETEQETEKIIEDYVQNDFEQTVSFSWEIIG